MERFNLDTWLQDKSRKVIDDDGFPVEIIKWDANEKCPVVYLNHNGIAYNVSADGMYDADPNHGLFFADEKEELTEFDKCLLSAFYSVAGKAVTTIGPASFQEDVNEWSKTLLDLARKEILKDLPKWKEAKENRTLPYGVVKIDKDGKIIYSDIVWGGEYFIMLQSLKLLPKEE